MRVLILLSTFFLFSLVANAQQPQPTPTPNTQGCPQSLLDSCTNAANQLSAANTLIEAQKLKIAALEERLALEQQRSALYKEIADVRTSQRQDLIEIIKLQKEQNDNLREIVKVGNETIKELSQLKKKPNFWETLGKEALKGAIFLGVGKLLTQ